MIIILRYYVIKFRGAGQGKKALIAELIGGELARAMGLKVPELVFMNLDESFSKTEPDEEIQDLLRFSVGMNLGLHYLAGAITFDPLVSEADVLSASKVVLLDALITNIDRTHRNTNMLIWHKELWLIDHGAALYFHHSWNNWEEHAKRGFASVKDHVMLGIADALPEVEKEIRERVSRETIADIVSVIPEEWLEDEADPLGPAEKRKAYVDFIATRLDNLETFRKEAENAR